MCPTCPICLGCPAYYLCSRTIKCLVGPGCPSCPACYMCSRTIVPVDPLVTCVLYILDVLVVLSVPYVPFAQSVPYVLDVPVVPVVPSVPYILDVPIVSVVQNVPCSPRCPGYPVCMQSEIHSSHVWSWDSGISYQSYIICQWTWHCVIHFSDDQ